MKKRIIRQDESWDEWEGRTRWRGLRRARARLFAPITRPVRARARRGALRWKDVLGRYPQILSIPLSAIVTWSLLA